MKFPKKSAMILLSFLILINILLRYPIHPHESGWDSFYIHSLANTVRSNGYCTYYLSPFSYFGMYPYSYASGVPLILSSISSVTNLEMDITILFFTALYGCASGFNAFIMSREIKKDFLFNFIVAFLFSTSPGILDMSTWQISTRGPFIVLTPVLFFMMLRAYNNKSLVFASMSGILFVVLMAVHHLYFYLVPTMLVYFLTIGIYALRRYIKLSMQEKHITIAIFSVAFAITIILFFLPYTNLVTNAYPNIIPRDLKDKSILYIMWVTILNNGRYIGISGLFGAIGFFVIGLSPRKKFGETFIFLATVGLMPFFVIQTYTKWFALTIVFALCAYGFIFVYRKLERKKFFMMLASTFLIILIMSEFFQYTHPSWLSKDKPYNERWMTEEDYNIAVYIKYMAKDKFVYDESTLGIRVLAIANDTQKNNLDSIKPYVDAIIKSREWKDTRFWSDAPFYLENRRSKGPTKSEMIQSNAESSVAKEVIEKYGYKYCLTNNLLLSSGRDSLFFNTLVDYKYKVFDNGKGSVWAL